MATKADLELSRSEEGRKLLASDDALLSRFRVLIEEAVVELKSALPVPKVLSQEPSLTVQNYNGLEAFDSSVNETLINDWTRTFRTLRGATVACLSAQQAVHTVGLLEPSLWFAHLSVHILSESDLDTNPNNTPFAPALHRAALGCLQFLVNAVTGNSTNQALVWQWLWAGRADTMSSTDGQICQLPDGCQPHEPEASSKRIIDLLLRSSKAGGSLSTGKEAMKKVPCRGDGQAHVKKEVPQVGRPCLAATVALLHNCCVGCGSDDQAAPNPGSEGSRDQGLSSLSRASTCGATRGPAATTMCSESGRSSALVHDRTAVTVLLRLATPPLRLPPPLPQQHELSNSRPPHEHEESALSAEPVSSKTSSSSSSSSSSEGGVPSQEAGRKGPEEPHHQQERAGVEQGIDNDNDDATEWVELLIEAAVKKRGLLDALWEACSARPWPGQKVGESEERPAAARTGKGLDSGSGDHRADDDDEEERDREGEQGEENEGDEEEEEEEPVLVTPEQLVLVNVVSSLVTHHWAPPPPTAARSEQEGAPFAQLPRREKGASAAAAEDATVREEGEKRHAEAVAVACESLTRILATFPPEQRIKVRQRRRERGRRGAGGATAATTTTTTTSGADNAGIDAELAVTATQLMHHRLNEEGRSVIIETLIAATMGTTTTATTTTTTAVGSALPAAAAFHGGAEGPSFAPSPPEVLATAPKAAAEEEEEEEEEVAEEDSASSSSSSSCGVGLCERMVACGLVPTLVALLHDATPQHSRAPVNAPPSPGSGGSGGGGAGGTTTRSSSGSAHDPHLDPLFLRGFPEGRRVALVRLTANLCFGPCASAQNAFRRACKPQSEAGRGSGGSGRTSSGGDGAVVSAAAAGTGDGRGGGTTGSEDGWGLAAVLNQCNLDKEDPRPGSAFLREWGIFAVRNLCDGNALNQAAIDALVPQAIASSGAASPSSSPSPSSAALSTSSEYGGQARGSDTRASPAAAAAATAVAPVGSLGADREVTEALRSRHGLKAELQVDPATGKPSVRLRPVSSD